MTEAEFGPDLPMPHFDRRRATDPQIEALAHRVARLEERLETKLELVLDRKLGELREELRKEIRDDMAALVPDGDVAGHRRAHEEMIRNANRWNAVKFTVLEHLAKTIGVALVAYIGIALFEQFRRSL